jgi:AraC-like DNA-binding protein
MSSKTDLVAKKINAVQLEIQDLERVAREADFKPARMAALCAISERHLQRIFKKRLRCTPSHWLRDLRCRLASVLISQGYSSKAAAAELKFATDAHFCREFKKIFGTSPKSFAPQSLARLAEIQGEPPARHPSSLTTHLQGLSERQKIARPGGR